MREPYQTLKFAGQVCVTLYMYLRLAAFGKCK